MVENSILGTFADHRFIQDLKFVCSSDTEVSNGIYLYRADSLLEWLAGASLAAPGPLEVLEVFWRFKKSHSLRHFAQKKLQKANFRNFQITRTFNKTGA